MFKYEDWFDYSDNTEYIESIENQELYNAIAEKVPDNVCVPLYPVGMARIFDGVPIPSFATGCVGDDSEEVLSLIEDVIEAIYDFTGFITCDVVGPTDEGRITYNGSAYIVQFLGSFAEGFPTLGEALEWADSQTW